MGRNGFNNTHVRTQVHWLRCFLRGGEVAGGYKDTSFYYCMNVLVPNPHCSFHVLHLKTLFFYFQISCVSRLSADFRSHLDARSHASACRFSVLRPQSVISYFHRTFETSGLNPSVMQLSSCGVASLSVVFIQLNDASRACQHFKPRIVSQPSFSSDHPLSLLVIRRLLYHTNSSIITVQRHRRKERQAAPNGLLSPMPLCVWRGTRRVQHVHFVITAGGQRRSRCERRTWGWWCHFSAPVCACMHCGRHGQRWVRNEPVFIPIRI